MIWFLLFCLLAVVVFFFTQPIGAYVARETWGKIKAWWYKITKSVK